ncbi:enoyl-CoA hydratase-related protein [Rhodococcus sp. NPDC056960]|uniref:enoyl-CoA hydratase-related protein n=1 Tax=Rhodococcus sp. NPDC056960 TaxID=3345982 RepID=UPI00362DCD59
MFRSRIEDPEIDDQQGHIRVERDHEVATIVFSRVHAHNALTEAMYAELDAALTDVDADGTLKALVLRGEGMRAFTSGTDANYIAGMRTGPLGLRYEQGITRLVTRLRQLRIPVVAVISGHCYGAGLLLAAASDIRIATPTSRFGVPVAKTMGNCLSANSISLLRDRLGSSVVGDMLIRARAYTADEFVHNGFVNVLSSVDTLDRDLGEVLDDIRAAAPLTIWAAKETLSRLQRDPHADCDDIVGTVYGSDDFSLGTSAFLARSAPVWTGR